MAGRARHKIVQISPPLVPDRDDAGGGKGPCACGTHGELQRSPPLLDLRVNVLSQAVVIMKRFLTFLAQYIFLSLLGGGLLSTIIITSFSIFFFFFVIFFLLKILIFLFITSFFFQFVSFGFIPFSASFLFSSSSSSLFLSSASFFFLASSHVFPFSWKQACHKHIAALLSQLCASRYHIII